MVVLSLVISGCLLGVLLTAVRLPGTWLILLLGLGLGWRSDWRMVTANTAWILAALATIGEVAELGVSMLTAQRAGASRRATILGTVGGLIGMVLSAPLPPPLIAPIGGALLGCFAGAALGELWKRPRLNQGVRVGAFAAIGFALGMTTKVAIALCMSVLIVWQVCRAR